MVVAIVLVAVAIPMCEMVGCDMGMCGGMMPFSTHPGPVFGGDCSGSWLVGAAQVGVLPTNVLSMLVALLAALGAAVLMFSPKVAVRPIRIAQANAPPPPIEPRGERYTL